MLNYIKNGLIKESENGYLIIYPKKFNTLSLNKVLIELKKEGYAFYKVFDVIKAIKENV
jgi:hypothetical protein